MKKEYKVENVEKENDYSKDLDKKIRNNKIFALAAFLVAGVAFGLGDQIVSPFLQDVFAFGAIGVSSANIMALKENLKIKSGQVSKENNESHTRGK